MDHLIHEGGLQTLAGDHRANEPHEKCEQEVEGHEEAKETPDVRHPSVLHCARDKILAQNDVRGARYAVMSLQAPLGVDRSAQQGFRGSSNLPLVLCHSTRGASDIHDHVGRSGLVNPHESNRVEEESTVEVSQSCIVPLNTIFRPILQFQKAPHNVTTSFVAEVNTTKRSRLSLT